MPVSLPDIWINCVHSVDTTSLLFVEDYVLSASQFEEVNKGELLSNSSLRRKLFGNDEDSLDSATSTPEKDHPALAADFLLSPALVSCHSHRQQCLWTVELLAYAIL